MACKDACLGPNKKPGVDNCFKKTMLVNLFFLIKFLNIVKAMLELFTLFILLELLNIPIKIFFFLKHNLILFSYDQHGVYFLLQNQSKIYLHKFYFHYFPYLMAQRLKKNHFGR